MNNTKVKIDLLFETSWEVCNKIGGIYAVLSTKARTLQNLYKDRVVFIGPDVWTKENPSPYFIESRSLLNDWKKSASLPDGITVRIGRWNVPGKPIVILVKFDGMYAVKDQFYARMWDLYGVDSLHAYGDYDEACAFSHAAAIVIESVSRHFGIDGHNIVAHFDEWTTGMGLLALKASVPQIATVFTTHATSIGRSICGNNKPLYDYFNGYNGDQMAAELNMQSKHSLEKTAAHQADCFTTVSEVTAAECAQLLDIRPHVVTPNGFEQDFVPAKSKMAEARATAREKLLNTASSLIGRKQPDNSFIVATSGRCEFRNKGIDLFLDSVRLMAESDPKRNIICYIMVPAWSREPRPDLLKALSAKRKSRLDDPVITHWLNNPDTDPIIGAIHRLGMTNDIESNVKVIYVPCYLDGADGIFDMSYYSLLAGMDATVFPSYYEPWGYTPMESVAFGVPTVTTTLSGFGQWILGNFDNNFEACGVNVIARGDSNYHNVVEAIASDLLRLS
ncbi:MAG: glycogen/starch synthase, partial [Muribaculaceae bacterium]|nr:glycogen/starch synthase [Muribaculaceae bacterium]